MSCSWTPRDLRSLGVLAPALGQLLLVPEPDFMSLRLMRWNSGAGPPAAYCPLNFLLGSWLPLPGFPLCIRSEEAYISCSTLTATQGLVVLGGVTMDLGTDPSPAGEAVGLCAGLGPKAFRGSP